MALVRISKQLYADVKEHVRFLANNDYNNLPRYNDELKDHGPGPRMAADAALWGEHLHLRDQIPEAWTKLANAAYFHTRHVHPDGREEHTSAVKCDIPNLRVPPGVDLQYNYARGSRDWHVVVNMDFALVRTLAEDVSDPRHALAARIMDVVNYEQARSAAARQWEKRLQGLNEFFGKCKSLNEAVKLWPGVRMYVPKNYLEQLDTPVVRPQAVVRKESVLATVDTDDLTAAAVAARLQGLV